MTPAGGKGNQEAPDFIASLHPMKRMAAAEEIAQSALFLPFGRAQFITGSLMMVDGGMSVRLL